jgi:hypothetical protein
MFPELDNVGIRVSSSGAVFATTEKPVDLKVHTKCPSKYLLIDEETGQVYRGNEKGFWYKIKAVN